MLVAIALANKMARAIWAMLRTNEDYWRRLRLRDRPAANSPAPVRGCEKATTRMGATVEQIWIRTPAEAKEPMRSLLRFGPDLQITIPVSGLWKCRT
ncbi:hypothetical protein [Mesorhizobium sp. M0208]|uniref:hypothetical protein n=1 Tax=Mesorhizobium sp. M0208 TaxID=2956916 RepID=UPI00333C57AC